MNAISRSPIAVSHFPTLNQSVLSPEPFVYTHYGPEGIQGKLRILPASHTPALQAGLDLLNQRPLVLLGISLGNTFFTRKRIEIAVCAMAHLFDQVHIVIPDVVTAHTYKALGYDEQRSNAKARSAGQKIRNRCQRAIERARLDNPAANLQILDWERDISSHPGYWEAYAHVCKLFDSNKHFQKDVLDKGYAVLSKKLPEEAITSATVRECIEYLLKEFAYLMICNEVSGRDLVIPYHQDSALGQRFCDGKYQDSLPGIGYLIFEIELVGETEIEDVETTESMLMPA